MHLYLTFTLPYAAVVLPPIADASNGPSARPRINSWVTEILEVVDKISEE